MDERARREGMAFVSAENNGSRTYSRNDIDGCRIVYMILAPDGREQFFKSDPPAPARLAALFQPQPRASSPPGARVQMPPLTAAEVAAAQRPIILGPRLSTWEKVKTWFAIIFFYIPLSLGGMVGSSYGVYLGYVDLKTVSFGTFSELQAARTSKYIRNGNAFYYGKVYLPNGQVIESKLDRPDSDAASNSVLGWHLDTHFVQKKDEHEWIAYIGCFGLMLAGSLVILRKCMSGIWALVMGEA